MDLQSYRKQRHKIQEQTPVFRELCHKCLQPQFSCYCKYIHRFYPEIDFIILIHPIEVRRRIATGRMAHLILENSKLIPGQNYSLNDEVNSLIKDRDRHCVILYPGLHSENLSVLSQEDRLTLFPPSKKLTLFVIDGTWATARRTMYQSENLKLLPKICFSPQNPSTFRVRKQPNAICYSTIEAIHHTIQLIGSSQGFDTNKGTQDNLLEVFNKMVELQLEFIKLSEAKPGALRYRRNNVAAQNQTN